MVTGGLRVGVHLIPNLRGHRRHIRMTRQVRRNEIQQPFDVSGGGPVEPGVRRLVLLSVVHSGSKAARRRIVPGSIKNESYIGTSADGKFHGAKLGAIVRFRNMQVSAL